MYEFINHNGERVSVRSARTLGLLLSEGSIKGETPFRRAEDPTYVPAATHAELGRIARDAGITLVASPEPLPTTKSTSPIILRPDAIILPELGSAVPAIMPAALPTDLNNPPIAGKSPRARTTAAGQGWTRPLTATSTVPRPPPLALTLPPQTAGWRVVVVILHYVGMATASIAGGALVGGVTRSVVAGSLSATLVFLAAAHWAGRLLATKRDVPPGWEALLAVAIVCAIATAVAGYGGLVLSGLAGAILWRALKLTRASRA